MRCVTAGIHFVPAPSENKFAAQNVGSGMKSSVKNVNLRGEAEPLSYLPPARPSRLRSIAFKVFQRSLANALAALRSQREALHAPQQRNCGVVTHQCECFQRLSKFSRSSMAGTR